MRLQREAQEGGMTKRHKKTFGVMGMFSFLTVVMVSWMYTYLKTCQIVYFKHKQLLLCHL